MKRVTERQSLQARHRRSQHEVENSGKIPVDAANALPNRPPLIGKTAEKAARLRSSPLTFSSRSAANPRQNQGLPLKFLPRWKRTRKRLWSAAMPSLPDVSWATTLRWPIWHTRWQPRYLLTRPDWCCQAHIFGRQRRGAPSVLGQNPQRVGNAVLESDP